MLTAFPALFHLIPESQSQTPAPLPNSHVRKYFTSSPTYLFPRLSDNRFKPHHLPSMLIPAPPPPPSLLSRNGFDQPDGHQAGDPSVPLDTAPPSWATSVSPRELTSEGPCNMSPVRAHPAQPLPEPYHRGSQARRCVPASLTSDHCAHSGQGVVLKHELDCVTLCLKYFMAPYCLPEKTKPLSKLCQGFVSGSPAALRPPLVAGTLLV